MNIQLKNIKFSEWNSEETNNFQATIHLNGKKVGYCKNDGRGGCTEYYGVEKYHSDDIKQMEEYCNNLPPIQYHGMSIPMNLENYIDQLFEEWLKNKDKERLNKKMVKDMSKGLVYETPNGYEILYWKKFTIEKFLESVNGTEFLKKQVDKLLGEGKKVLNTNIPFLNNPHVR